MARKQYTGIKSRERGVALLHGKVSIGAVGAPTVVRKNSIVDVVRTGAGTYEVEFLEKFVELQHFSVIQLGAAQDLTFQLLSETISTDGKLIFVCKAAAVPTDPVNPSTLLIKCDVKDTSVLL